MVTATQNTDCLATAPACLVHRKTSSLVKDPARQIRMVATSLDVNMPNKFSLHFYLKQSIVFAVTVVGSSILLSKV